MRLVSTDDICNLCTFCFHGECMDKDCECLVRKLPTAYDVDKVIRQLEASARIIHAHYECGICSEGSYKTISLRKALEIVKRGGV